MSYPINLEVETPQKLSRLTTFFRAFLLIPQYFVFFFVSLAAYAVFFLSWWAILFTTRYPRVFFDFLTWWVRWYARLTGYTFLLTDKYPPFSGSMNHQYPITFGAEYPGKLSRLATFFRFPFIFVPVLGNHWHLQPQITPGLPLAIPHYFMLYFISLAGGLILFLSWWAILFIGRYPGVFFEFVGWWFRWTMRVTGYVYLLTDRYPPFSGAA